MMHALRPAPGIPKDGDLDRRPVGSGLPCRVWVFLALGLGSFLLLLPAAGCLFSTRTPELPSVNNVPWADPIAPEKVLTNVLVTFAAKSIANYDRSLASDFTFDPADADRQPGDPTYFDGWNKQREVAAFTSVFQQSEGTVTFTWGPPIPRLEDMLTDDADPGGGRFYKDLKYRMVFRRSGADTTISGLANLYLRDQSGGWSIYKWIDQQDGLGNATLGLVRYNRRVVW